MGVLRDSDSRWHMRGSRWFNFRPYEDGAPMLC